ncbi:metal ABC transporter solute-binding protein, Zn/Mn family [Paracoccus beibuensis]|uniref:metal ABC transporter solute-binding protein, Zn/Mn family n=1 Tax=Paracoccus beibuensis TaxID=547602 RepID=UPI002AD4187F|nr:zinc ABC transporter substrate-binding protein [Paracoccus beibuensis]
MKHVLSTLSMIGLGLWAGAASAQDKPVKVVATIGMIGDIVENVGGNCVDVMTIMGPGVDPHLYQASASDVRTFQAGDVIFYSGYSLEGQLAEVLAKFAERKPTVAVASTSIDETDLIKTQGAYGVDPHLWMDAGLWSRIAPTIAEALGEVRPACADLFAANAGRYAAQVTALDAWAEQAIATIPEGQRSLVTAHDAFAYFGRAYGIRVASIQGISTESEASIADIRASADLVARTGVPALFVESTINPRTVQSVIDAARQQGTDVKIGGQLYSDAMGEDGTPGGTYIGMIFENTRTITEALGGTLPELPVALAGWAEEWNVVTKAR